MNHTTTPRSLFERLAGPLIAVTMVTAGIVFSQAVSFSMPDDHREDPIHFLQMHAWLLALGGMGLLIAGRVVSDLLKRVAELERRLKSGGAH